VVDVRGDETKLLSPVLSHGTGPIGPANALPILDRGVFLETIKYIPAAELAANLSAVMARCKAMLSMLRRPGALADSGLLCEHAHKLAGIVGMFGLLSVSAIARDFERAAEVKAPEAAALLERFDIALDASVTALALELIGVGILPDRS